MTEQQNINFGEPIEYPPTILLVEIGDEVQGIVVEMGEVTLEDRNAGYIHIKSEKGVGTLWLGKVLTEAVIKNNVSKGDYIGVKFLGLKPARKGSPYRNYDVRVVKGDRGV